MLPGSFPCRIFLLQAELNTFLSHPVLFHFAYVKSVITGFLRLTDKQSQNNQHQKSKNTGYKIEVLAFSFTCILT